jgi:hypothetical protein
MLTTLINYISGIHPLRVHSAMTLNLFLHNAGEKLEAHGK